MSEKQTPEKNHLTTLVKRGVGGMAALALTTAGAVAGSESVRGGNETSIDAITLSQVRGESHTNLDSLSLPDVVNGIFQADTGQRNAELGGVINNAANNLLHATLYDAHNNINTFLYEQPSVKNGTLDTVSAFNSHNILSVFPVRGDVLSQFGNVKVKGKANDNVIVSYSQLSQRNNDKQSPLGMLGTDSHFAQEVKYFLSDDNNGLIGEVAVVRGSTFYDTDAESTTGISVTRAGEPTVTFAAKNEYNTGNLTQGNYTKYPYSDVSVENGKDLSEDAQREAIVDALQVIKDISNTLKSGVATR